MNKLFTKIATACVGLAMAIGVGVSVGNNSKEVAPAYAATTTDTLDRAKTGRTGTSYGGWTGKTSSSAAVYAGNSAGGNSSIQLRSSDGSGIWTTASGGTIKSVSVTWNSNTASGRTLNIYGSDSAYSSQPSNTFVGSIVYGTSTSYTFEADYKYVAVKSSSGAMYLTNISFVWDTTVYHTVTFDSKGGSNSPANKSVENGQTFTFPSPGTKDGFTFLGWSSDSGSTKYVSGATSPAINADTDYVAYWKSDSTTYTVTFDSNGGSESPEDQEIIEGQTFTFPSPGTKANHTFLGWSCDGGTTKYASGTTSLAVNANADYVAYWDENAKVAVTYKAGAGTGSDVSSSEYVGPYTLSSFPGTWTSPSGKVFSKWSDGTNQYAAGANYTLVANTPVTFTAVYVNAPDVLTRSFTGVGNTSTYSNWSGKSGSSSSAVYAGNSAGDNDSIQLRSNNNNSGVISTTSGGYVDRIVVTWQASTANNRTINIYGSSSAYTSASELYSTNTQGTLLGTIVNGTSTELTVSGDYEYVGIRSADGALYLSEVDIYWRAPSPVVTAVTLKDAHGNDVENNADITIKEDDSTTLTVGITGSHLTGSEEITYAYEEVLLTSSAFSFSPASPLGDGDEITITANDPDAAGTLTFSCGGQSIVVNLYSEEAKVLYGLDYSGTYKSSYVAGEVFVSSGLTITATYTDETTANVTSQVTFPSSTLVLNQTYVEVSYSEGGETRSCQIPVTVEADYLNSLTFDTSNAKTTYAIGDTWDNSATGVTASGKTYMNEDVNLTASQLSYSGYNLSSAGQQTVTVSYPNPKGGTFSTTYSITVTKIVVATVVDEITIDTIGITGTSYSNWEDLSVSSSAIYAGTNAKSNSSNGSCIQIRSNDNKSGIVSTTSGGTATSVKIDIYSSSNGVDVYGSNTAYSGSSDLFSEGTAGTLIGEQLTATTTITTSFKYIGVRSHNGASYVNSITIKWENSEANVSDVSEVDSFISTNMHLDYTKDEGFCKDSTNHWYTTARDAFNLLTDNQKYILLTSNSNYDTVTIDPNHKKDGDPSSITYTYRQVMDRLETWASFNGESLNNNTNVLGASRNNLMINNSVDSTLVIVAISTVSVLAIGGYFFIRKKKLVK